MFSFICSNLLTDAEFTDTTVFPFSIQSFESLACEFGPHLVAKDQVCVRYRPALFLLPSLAHTELVKQIARDVGFERNLHE